MNKLAACGTMTLALAATVLGCSGSASAQTALESSFVLARAELARAMHAHGGVERIGKVSAARLELEGEISTGIQGRSPEAIARSQAEGDFATRVTIDLAKGRSRTSGEQRSLGGVAYPFTVIYSDAAIKTLTDFPPQLQRQPVGDADEGREQTAGIGTRMAPLLLLKLAAQRLATPRHEGTATVEGRRVTCISFNADKSTRVTLAIDAENHRMTGLEQLAADPLLGLDTTRWIFTGT